MTELSYDEKLSLVKKRISSLDRNPSEEQLDFVLHPLEDPCYLKACPGSGKTEVVGIKAAYEIADWTEKFVGLAILSFTRTAANVIADRIRKFGGANATKHPHFIGTIDSWLHGYVLHPFGHNVFGYVGKDSDKSYQLLVNDERSDFLTPFRTVFSYKPFKGAWVNEYYFECNDPVKLQSQSKTLNLTTVSEAIEEELKKKKKQFLKSGVATYADAEFLSFYLLKKNQNILENLVKRFPVFIIDECQDLSHNQLEILRLLSEKGAVIHFVGDNNQSIYKFKDVSVEKINAFISDNNFTERLLTKNFRSNQKIVNVSIGLEKYNTGNTPIQVVGNEEEITTRSCILWEYTPDNFSQLPQKFIEHLNLVNSNTQKPLSKTDSAILARAHSTLSGFRNQPKSQLKKIELFANGLGCWANSPRTGKDMQNALQQIGKSISLLGYDGNGNHQHQYCPNVYSEIEWRNQLSDLIESVKNPASGIYPFENSTWSQWVGKLKPFLESYWSNFRSPAKDWDSLKRTIKSPSGKASKPVSDTMKANQNMYSEKIRMTTFHDVKGETLDAVLVVSAKDKRSKGGHVEQWLTDVPDKKEHVRFAYVASSRPKHILIWAIPKTTDNEFVSKILDLGFERE